MNEPSVEARQAASAWCLTAQRADVLSFAQAYALGYDAAIANLREVKRTRNRLNKLHRIDKQQTKGKT